MSHMIIGYMHLQKNVIKALNKEVQRKVYLLYVFKFQRNLLGAVLDFAVVRRAKGDYLPVPNK
jgi:hypothetical protein